MQIGNLPEVMHIFLSIKKKAQETNLLLSLDLNNVIFFNTQEVCFAVLLCLK